MVTVKGETSINIANAWPSNSPGNNNFNTIDLRSRGGASPSCND